MNARDPFVLGDWTVDPTTGTVTGPAGQRRLTPKLSDLLVALAQRNGQVASRDELLREVWGERGAVADEPLTRAVAELRRLLGDVRADPTYIETIPKRGYRLVAAVGPAPAASATATPPVVAAVDTQVAAAQPHRPTVNERRWRLAAIGLGVAAVAILGFALSVRSPPRAPVPAIASVAVLPFADLSPAEDRQYFADGVQEEIISRLTGIPELRVATRSAVNAYRERGLPARDIAVALGATAVLEGSVRYADERVRVVAQLIDATSATNLWSETFDRPLSLTALFDIQADIAAGVAAGLVRSLTAKAEGGSALPTQNLAAYEAFLLGKYHYRRRQPGDVAIAIEQFQAAVDADREFAAAWDWLSYAWLEAGVDLPSATPERAFPRARAAALRALELEPTTATASALLGFLRATYDWDWQGGLAELERAAAAAPNETGTVWSYAYVLSLLGRHDDAVALVDTLASRFPQDGRLEKEVAERLIDAARYAEAETRANRALEKGAERGLTRELVGIAAFGSGDWPAAIAALEEATELLHSSIATTGRLAAAYARAGRTDDARRLLGELEARAGDDPLSATALARAHAALGDRERALTLLAGAVEQRQREALGIGLDPFFASLRAEPRYAELVARMGLGR